MPEDRDAVMLKQLGYALGELQYKYKVSGPIARTKLRPELEAIFKQYQDYRIMLLGPSAIVSDADVKEMKAIRAEIEKAASKQQLLVAIGRIAGFLIPRIV